MRAPNLGAKDTHSHTQSLMGSYARSQVSLLRQHGRILVEDGLLPRARIATAKWVPVDAKNDLILIILVGWRFQHGFETRILVLVF